MMSAAGIAIVDPAGKATTIKGSSWRAGGVRSANDVNTSDAMIEGLGRWRSKAWRHYLCFPPLDLQGACLRMWEVGLGVNVFSVALRLGGEKFRDRLRQRTCGGPCGWDGFGSRVGTYRLCL